MPIWIGAEGVETAGVLRQEVQAQQERLADYRGARIALQFNDDLLLARALVMLDGEASLLLILSREIAPHQVASFMGTAGAEALLSDGETIRNEELPFSLLSWTGGQLPEAAFSSAEAAGNGKPGTSWVLTTSGTTGTPKLVAHTVSSLTRTAKRNSEQSNLFRWGMLYELARFAGLQVFFQAFLSGSALLIPPAEANFSERVEFLIKHGCTALSATPTLWRKLLMSADLAAMPIRQITLGGEVADQKLLDALSDKFGEARVTHIYASTEAGVGFAVNDRKAGFPASWLQDPPKGIRLRVDERGMLYLRPDKQEQTYLGEQDSLLGEDGFVESGDLTCHEGDRIFFRGR